MFWYRIIYAIIAGTILSITGQVLTILFSQNANEVYHIRKDKADGFILASISAFTVLLIALILLINPENVDWFGMIPGVMVMEIMAITDLKIGRIPYCLIIITLLISFYYGILTSQTVNFLTGGIIGLGLGLTIYIAGKKYIETNYPDSRNLTAFGFGDVIGAAIIGLLLGFPMGFWAFLAALILVVIVKSVFALINGRSVLKAEARLGPFFFFGYAFLVLSQISHLIR